MSKEKRIADKAEKQRIAGEKRAIEVAKILLTGKNPLNQNISSPIKKPRQSQQKCGGLFPLLVTVSQEKEDREGVWSWGISRDWHPEPGNDHINEFLNQYQNVKLWREVFEEKTVGKGESVKLKHVKYAVSEIGVEAQKRLDELKMDDFEDIFRFRMTNLERLYGFIAGSGEFLTLWYDPTHKIYSLD